jgi:two-component system CheB/CheR fusion protein
MKIPFKTLIEQITGHAIVILDAEGIIQSWNAGAREITGYSAREAVGRSLAMLLGERVAGEVMKAGNATMQCWLTRKQGEPVWTRNVVQRVGADDGKAAALCWMCQDPFDT